MLAKDRITPMKSSSGTLLKLFLSRPCQLVTEVTPINCSRDFETRWTWIYCALSIMFDIPSMRA